LDNREAYVRWRDDKLHGYPEKVGDLMVELADWRNPGATEIAALKERINKTNMVLYSCGGGQTGDVPAARKTLRALGLRLGLKRLDGNSTADEDDITPLFVRTDAGKGRYIPYTNEPINWHTDGYYNKPQNTIRAMVLHCLSPAAQGGENALMDPDIAYILMRDENPDFIRALMHPEALLIPANIVRGEVIRAAQPGPVFSCSDNDNGGALHMRYTARTRSIEWRDDEPTSQAVAFLSALFRSDSPYIFRHRMASGEGVLCNNVLHNRRSFDDDDDRQRLFLRARYLDRIDS